MPSKARVSNGCGRRRQQTPNQICLGRNLGFAKRWESQIRRLVRAREICLPWANLRTWSTRCFWIRSFSKSQLTTKVYRSTRCFRPVTRLCNIHYKLNDSLTAYFPRSPPISAHEKDYSRPLSLRAVRMPRILSLSFPRCKPVLRPRSMHRQRAEIPFFCSARSHLPKRNSRVKIRWRLQQWWRRSRL